MKFLLTLFAILLVAVVIANLAVTEPGYVLLSYGKSSIELPLIDFLVALLLLFFLSYLLIRFLLGLRRTPAGLKKLNANRKSTNSRKGLLQGLIEMAEGNWQKAEKHLVRSAGNSDLPVLSYLAAAHAAQRQENPDRRDDYLRMASQSDPKAEVAIGLAQAELQIRSKQFEEALATLQHLESQAPKHRFVKKLLARLHYEMKNWDALKTLIPDLRKQQTVTEKELLKFETATYAAQLRQTDSLKETESIWQSLSKDSRNQPQLAQHYFKALIRFGESEKAEQLLRKSLN
ncbi:MAG TPA: heme biosynthesis protein HemY, partial [Gammaproteobacteria bacterium]|nr:heme biosynthesis protein HemY [Gammaproteobacteria bacterium]